VYTLDTNAILYYLKDDAAAVSVLRGVFAENVPVYVSAITELELYAFPNISPDEESLIEDLLATISVIPLDSHIARLAALCAKTLTTQSTRQCDCRHRNVYRQYSVNTQHSRLSKDSQPYGSKGLVWFPHLKYQNETGCCPKEIFTKR
jgi:predicted nucleic acid-binding protein